MEREEEIVEGKKREKKNLEEETKYGNVKREARKKRIKRGKEYDDEGGRRKGGEKKE